VTPCSGSARQAIRAQVRTDSNTGTVPNNLWGYGKLHFNVARTPSATTSVIKPVIVGDTSGTPILGGYQVTVNDGSGAPVANVPVVLNFDNTSVRLYSDTNVDCTNKLISAMTDANGRATFAPRFGGFVNTPLVEVKAAGVLLGLG